MHAKKNINNCTILLQIKFIKKLYDIIKIKFIKKLYDIIKN